MSIPPDPHSSSTTPPPGATEDWNPGLWRAIPTTQQPEYADSTALAAAVASLRSLPPLVTSWEIDRLRKQLAEAADGQRFLLQGGDCAERFDECASEPIAARLK
ncbi:MAG: 3-deoxy-7-phosphoheptulonate synthase, partial [Planctomycetota bacterium]|nr:3-deoxy-7-phosphoheptulonate synthase [Planctomycetota bacterium]